MDFAVGYRLPAVFTASGRAILSKLDEKERLEVLSATPLKTLTPFTEIRPDKLLAHIAEAAKRGYAVVVDQAMVGDISIAAAITDHRGRPVGAINISVPTTRWTLETAEAKLASHVQLAATSISQSKVASYL